MLGHGSNVNPGLINLNKPLGCLIGRVPFEYQIMTVGGVRGYHLPRFDQCGNRVVPSHDRQLQP